MARHTRNSSEQGYSGLQTGLAPSPMYAPSRMLPGNYYDVPSSSSSSAMPIPPPLATQHPSQQQAYGPYSTSAPSPTLPMPPSMAQPSQHRPSSGAWNPQDDQQLLQARMQGLNWNQIRDQYFQSKTPNACRKRHERLMERRGADDWDARKMQTLAKEYMSMRKEIWSGLAARTGEKWSVVEAKCMSNGLKNLQSAARAASRRDRLETGASLTGYDDDSGISGIGLTPVDELDASYSSPATSSSGAHSFSSSASYHQQQQHQSQHHHHQQQQQHLQPPHSHSHLHPHSQHHHSSYGMAAAPVSTASMSHGYVSRGGTGTSQDSSPYLDSQRLSTDMGIESLVHRPNGGKF
ncbi:uncharacterized protein TRIREDRAFT_4124 [Trichoderma reesei QM6a]|uniref:Predicted protein n=2 Tax=Hypocrea jecorina TaxID=51453 RepID=G0RKM1_HYPJQ|nr:uncharacterized protein TRIREDRAFT_4124 [Trichoderma reesei QM6a]EGR48275.1 predicted protein [Trichoderma reesei QM6a]ETS07121.1 hypothetical protein M419DRAFT_68157 [Trichoderma reesei RUT C-30]